MASGSLECGHLGPGAQVCISFLNSGEKSERESEVGEDEDNFLVEAFHAPEGHSKP
jgi:hypothetical protein